MLLYPFWQDQLLSTLGTIQQRTFLQTLREEKTRSSVSAAQLRAFRLGTLREYPPFAERDAVVVAILRMLASVRALLGLIAP